MRKYLFLKMIAASAALIPAATLAADEPTAYVGADIGYGKYDEDLGSGISFSKNKVGGHGFVGFNFNQYVAIEAGYRDFGSVSWSGSGSSISAKATAAQLSVLGSWPVSTDVSLYGRLGIASVKVKASASSGGLAGTGSETKDKAVFGVGARFAVTPELDIRGEYDQYAKFDSLKLSVFSLGADFRF